jgi:hypothetical protein
VTKLASGSLKWGFPIFQLEGGREFLTFSGLDNQFQLVDQVSLSHSSDHYGDSKEDSVWTAKVLYGENEFNVFSSTDLISQTVNFKQKLTNGSLSASWNLSSRQTAAVKLDVTHFENDPLSVESYYNIPDFLEDIIDEFEDIPVDAAEAEALLRSTLTKSHDTSILDLNYNHRNVVELSAILGASRYKEELGEQQTRTDTDWKVRSVLGGRKLRLDGSYEKIGDYYRSIGNPIAYQNKSVTRLSPYAQLFNWWRIMGEFRREDTAVLENQGIPPYRTQSSNMVQIFNMPKNVIRLSGNTYESSLYGSRYSGNISLTQYLGPHSIDIGGGEAIQYDSLDRLYKRSKTGKGSFQFVKKDWKVSLGEEYTRHVYLTLNDQGRYESLSSLDFNWGGFRSLIQYQMQPRYFYQPEYLYTGFAKLGYQVGEKKFLDLFFSSTSLERNLSDPEAWRAGFEFSLELY